MTDIADKASLLKFIKGQKLAVVATVNAAREPEAALVGFGETDSFELFFGTSRQSRKYANLKHNPQVAVVIGLGGQETLQYEGTAEEVAAGEKLDSLKQLYFAKTPAAAKYEDRAGQTYFKVKPRWIRHTDISTDPETVTEIEF